jgi:hypothetical protein
MPNWNTNQINVSGDEKTLLELVEFVKSEELSFDFRKIVPYMGDGREITNDNFNAGGYDWCNKNWGTKWTIDEDTYSFGTGLNSVSFEFDTAWSPSLPVTLALSKKFPTLTFEHRYEEGGMDFSGVVEYIGGVEVVDMRGGYGDIRLNDFSDEHYGEENEDEEGNTSPETEAQD